MSTFEDLFKKVTVGEATVFDIVVGQDGSKTLAVETRKLLPEEPRPPVRAESPAKKHEFLAARSLADYLAKYGGENTVVFADPTKESIRAVLDDTAQEGFEIVEMRPEPHPLWVPWSKIAGAKIAIESFVEFVAQNRRAIVKPDGRELAMLLSQIRASVDVEIQVGRGKSAVNGLTVRTKIQGVDKSEQVDLPDTITIKVPLYVQTEAKEIELDLTLDANADGDVSVLVAASTVAEARVAAFEEMCAIVREGVSAKGATVTYGRPAHAPWAYLKEIGQ